MRWQLLSLFLAVHLQAAPTPFAQQAPLALSLAKPVEASVEEYRLVEIPLDLKAAYDNPFNPEEVEAWAVFTSPAGRVMRVNGFLDQSFTRRLEKGAEAIEPSSQPGWKIRFAANMPGVWRYRVFAKDRTGQAELSEASLQVSAVSKPGYIRRSQLNPGGFVYDNGSAFFAVGENVCWGGKRGSFDYDDWLPALSKAGGNWIRIWMCSWNCALEWSKQGRGDWRSGQYHGAGVYSLDNAWKLDTILDLAERQGIAVMLCFGTYGEFNDGGYFGEGQWKANPYNVTNGGPCQKSADFWTNDQARKLYRQRLRYLAARYGWRTGIQSWEFWNEAVPPSAWVAEMARYLKGTGEFSGQPADPFNHLVTTTYGTPDIWSIPEIDFTQTHSYGKGDLPDHAPIIHEDARAHVRFGKPHLMGEFGIDWRDSDSKYDVSGQGVNLHNGLWASAVSGNAGVGMIWYWDNYVHPRNLYSQFTPIRKFADAVAWEAGKWKTMDIPRPTIRRDLKPNEGLNLGARAGWGKPGKLDWTIDPGKLPDEKKLPEFLYGPAKPELRTQPVFKVKFDRAGRFAIKVDRVSVLARLRLVTDGRTTNEFVLSAAPPKQPELKPDYESTELVKEYNIYQARFNKEYGVDLAEGEHTVQLEVAEGDWLSIAHYSVTGYRTVEEPFPLNLFGASCGLRAVVWAQNTAHCWKNVFEKKPVTFTSPVQIKLPSLPAGKYAVTWWDTWNGAITRTETLQGAADGLPIDLPEIARDIALSIAPAL